MKVYDKSAWQIDGGMEPQAVKDHFLIVMDWLYAFGLLNSEGKELRELGIDSEFSLHEGLVTEEGAEFLDLYFDPLIKESGYDTANEKEMLTELYSKWSSDRHN